MDTFAENASVTIKSDGLTTAAKRTRGVRISAGGAGARSRVVGRPDNKTTCQTLELAPATTELGVSMPLLSPTKRDISSTVNDAEKINEQLRL